MDPKGIANAFLYHFKVRLPLSDISNAGYIETGATVTGTVIDKFSDKQVKKAMQNMMWGNSPGHDGLSIEHLKYSEVQLQRKLLAMFFNLCISHS